METRRARDSRRARAGSGKLRTFMNACAASASLEGSCSASWKKSSPNAKYAYGTRAEFGYFEMSSK
jgi:hypothetical protein